MSRTDCDHASAGRPPDGARRLSKDGFVSVRETPGEGGPPRKVYSLTREGCELLEQWRCVIEERVEVLSRFLQRYSGLPTDH